MMMTPRAMILLTLTGVAGLTWFQTEHPARPESAPSQSASPRIYRIAVPTLHKLSQLPAGDMRLAARRNPFRFTDETAPPLVQPPPPSPPPPPEVKPEARLIGTISINGIIALFSFKNDVIPVQEGDVLEEKYIVQKIDPESVLLEDRRYHNVATISLVKK